MKRAAIYIISGIVLFLIAYMVTGLLVHAIMGDEVYGESVTIGAKVKWIEVEELPYLTTEPLQSAELVQETHKPQVTENPQKTLVDMRCQFVDQINPDGSCDNSDPACPETIKTNKGRC